MKDAFDEIFQEHEEKARAEGRAEGEARGRAEGRAEGEARGEARGRAEGEARGLLSALSNLMKSTKWGIDQAMDALGIPLDQRDKYAELLSNH